MRFPAWLLQSLVASVFLAMPFTASPLRAADVDLAGPTPSALMGDPAGWEDVMPPIDLKGWFRVAIPSTGKLIRPQWHVEKDTLVCDGDGGHDMLLLDRKLTNCIFHVEFCFTRKTEGKMNYNSGVFIRTSRDGTIWYQAQVGSLGGGYWFGVTPDGATTRKIHAETKPCRVTAAGEWNTFELTADGPKLTLWVNGYVAAVLPDCGATDGYIGLEVEGYNITAI
jgi:hypothetical protein